MPMTIANADLRALADTHDIAPHRCPRCRTTYASGVSWITGYDDGRDKHYLGYQCRNCGTITGLTRGQILRRARQATRS